ncbi:phosphotransferase family enzyme [Deinococcus yavapaiensis KR-236]|uniref:Phosphotransferase family enzyme n=1 Tax=Deinococcus yavapaiensis KR-236 TaxID=694435 RepID=A0A318S1Z5_9DEIO|nr:phosphotransferase family enzyme [Deinococcus yavapaiensis KR-236]
MVVHGDFNSVNILYEDPSVTAALGLEFACVGARVLDITTALMEVLVRTEPDWTLARAFLRRYGPLEEDEANALAAAMLLRQAALGVWSVGQVEAGAPEAARAGARLRALPELLVWLGSHDAKLTTVGLHEGERFEQLEAR